MQSFSSQVICVMYLSWNIAYTSSNNVCVCILCLCVCVCVCVRRNNMSCDGKVEFPLDEKIRLVEMLVFCG